MYDRDFIDAIQIVSFIIGVLNYKENLTQNDKDDILNRLDQQTKDILTKVNNALEEQNEMLREILEKLKGGEENACPKS